MERVASESGATTACETGSVVGFSRKRLAPNPPVCAQRGAHEQTHMRSQVSLPSGVLLDALVSDVGPRRS